MTSRMDSLSLVHLWLDTLLECKDKSGGIMGEGVVPPPTPDTDDEGIFDEDIGRQ